LRVVVAGAGRLGSSLAKMLVEEGHQVTIVDSDEGRCSKLSAELDALVIKGDAAKLEVLKDAEVDKADVFIATTDRDEVNLVSCLLAKRLGSPRVIARVGDPALIRVAEELGIERALCPELVTAKLLSSLVSRGYGLAQLLAAGEEFSLLEVAVSPSSPFVGRSVKEVAGPPSSVILAVVEGGEVLKAEGDLKLREGQKLIVLARRGSEEEVKSFFTS
jgi:trk system potassium uptake protein TrkA